MSLGSANLSNLIDRAEAISESLPLVSIGVASYNNAHFIRETLDSIAALSYSNKELIIVDDASADDSVVVIENWLAAHPSFPARLVRHTSNCGMCQVCNRIVSEAQGEYVSIIGSDDLYKPHMITVSVAEIRRRGERCGAVYADCELIDRQGTVLSPSFLQHFDSRFGPNYPSGNLRVPLLQGFYLPAPTVLMRRAAVVQAGPYDQSLHAEDLDMWLRLCLNWEFAFLPCVVSAYRVHQLSATQVNRTGLNETFFQIYRKSRFAPGPEQAAAKRMLADHAEYYYGSRGAAATSVLWYAFRETLQPKVLAFWLMARLGVKYATLRQVLGR
ncbi:glycosyltransferase [Hymenobacter sp. BT664]|uniref:Glycosyltransferase n=1 Tax=Hymenobacter montanus TaxID=2771359 RepID=A0A927GHT4_9BACT|nr:glycosyltransferase [Hymenobacter montanus]MBD2766419.1 glycosyltransferase [Hymenobacter montanus]